MSKQEHENGPTNQLPPAEGDGHVTGTSLKDQIAESRLSRQKLAEGFILSTPEPAADTDWRTQLFIDALSKSKDIKKS